MSDQLPSQREWQDRAARSLADAQARRRRTHADPVRVAAWTFVVAFCLAFWGGMAWLIAGAV